MTVKCNLKKFLEERELTQQRFAAAAGLSPTTVGQLYRNSFRRLDNGTVETVCKFFGVELGDMFYIAPANKDEAAA